MDLKLWTIEIKTTILIEKEKKKMADSQTYNNSFNPQKPPPHRQNPDNSTK